MSTERAWLLAVVVFSGCFNPDDIIPIQGSVDAPGQRVELMRAVRCEDELKKLKEVNAADDGAFSFEVFRAQVQTLTSMQQQCLRVQSVFPSGTRADSTIRYLQLGVELPRFIDWQPAFSLDGGAFDFQGIDAGAYEVTHSIVVKTNDGGTVWTQRDRVEDVTGMRAQPLIIDERVLAEFDGTMTMEGRYGTPPRRGSDVPMVTITFTEMVRLRPTEEVQLVASRVPPSRGSTCDELPSPCVVTDGSLVDAFLINPEQWWLPGPQTLTMRFSSPFTPSLIVVRGLSASAEQEFVTGESGEVLAVFSSVKFVGLTADAREVELASPRLFSPFEYEPELSADGGFLPIAHSFVVPVETTESLVGVQLRTQGVMRVREISVF